MFKRVEQSKKNSEGGNSVMTFPPDFHTLKTKGSWSVKYSPSNTHHTTPVFMIVSVPNEFSTQLLCVCLHSKLGLREEEWSR